MAPVGAIFGGPIAGWIADFLGRKVALLLVAIPYLSGYMMITYAHFIYNPCLLYTSPSPRDATLSRMPSSA